MSWGGHEVKEQTNTHPWAHAHADVIDRDWWARLHRKKDERRKNDRGRRKGIKETWWSTSGRKSKQTAERQTRRRTDSWGWGAVSSSVCVFVLSCSVRPVPTKHLGQSDDPKYFLANSGVRFACSVPRQWWLIRNTRFKRAVTLAVIKLAVFGDVAVREISCRMGNSLCV